MGRSFEALSLEEFQQEFTETLCQAFGLRKELLVERQDETEKFSRFLQDYKNKYEKTKKLRDERRKEISKALLDDFLKGLEKDG
jgi:uncharacterized protein involved in exopolysaccharide biosynthesis